jgi:hypothetical protein
LPSPSPPPDRESRAILGARPAGPRLLEIGTSPILSISRRIRLRPTHQPWRRRWRVVWREPYQGHSMNCSSINRISVRFISLSPHGVR